MVTDKQLMEMADQARDFSHSPYSHFRVGAALLTKSGKVYTGCNIENAAFTPTICAERTAFFKAVSEGETAFAKIAIVGGKEGEISPFCAPCGVCRQVMTEFCSQDFVLLLGTPENFRPYTLAEIMPYSFSADQL